MRNRLFFYLEIKFAVTSFFIVNRPIEGFFNGVVVQPLKLEHPASRHDCGRHRGVRILRRRTDKDYRSVLDCRQKTVRLSFAEPMTFIEQQIGFFTI